MLRTTRRLLALPSPASSDGELIHRFATARDEDAFAELVRRHGGLVRGVARRVLADPHAADDVFQAAFLLLAAKAGKGPWGRTVGPWLYQAALRLAWKARRRARRPERSAPTLDTPAPAVDPGAPLAWAEVRAVLDAELARLPTAQRDPLVLCYLEGMTRDEAAAALGCSPGELKGRLERGRKTLRGRLERRGLALSTGLAAVLVADPGVPVAAAAATARLAAGCAAGAAPPAPVGDLLRGSWAGLGLKAAGVVAVLVAVALGAATVADVPRPAGAGNPPAAGTPAAADPSPPTADAHGDALPARAITRLGSIRFRPGAAVSALVFSPDGKQLASWGWARYRHDQFDLWDAASGRNLRSVRTSERTLLALTWAPDDRGYAVLKAGELGNENRIFVPDLRVWEFTNVSAEIVPPAPPGPPVFPGGNAPVSFDATAVSPDGKQLAIAVTIDGKPGKVRIYELKATESVAGLKPLAEFDAPATECKALAFTPDGRQLVGVGPTVPGDKMKGAGTVTVWDTKTRAVARTFPTSDGAAQGGDFHLAAANDRVAVGLGTGDTFVADLRTGTGRTIATGHKGKGTGSQQAAGVLALDFSPDGRTLVTTGGDGMVRVWDAAGAKVREFGSHESWPQAVAFAAGGAKIASGEQDGVIRIWDPAVGKELGPTGGLPHPVLHIAVSANGATAVTVPGDEVVRVWDARTGVLRRQIAAGVPITACRMTPDGARVVAVVGEWDRPDKTLRVWDAATGSDATPPGFPKTIVAGGFAFTPDGSTLITYFEDQLVAWAWPGGPPAAGPAGAKVWAADMPKPAKQPGINQVQGVAVSPDGRHFVTVAMRYRTFEERGLKFAHIADGVVDLWDTKTGKRLRRVAEGMMRPAVYARDGSLILTRLIPPRAARTVLPSVGGPGTKLTADIAAVDPVTGLVLREFTHRSAGPDGWPPSGYEVVLSADGKVLFRATAAGEVQAFEVATGKFRAAWPGHRDTILSLAAPAADVRRVVSGSGDTTGLVWDVGFAAPTPAPLTTERRTALWDTLTDGDAEKGYTAMRELAADPAGFTALVGEKLTPTPPGPPSAELAPIFRDLGSATFDTREAASAKLGRYGEAAVPQVRARFEKEESAEVRARLLAFLNRHGGSPTSGTGLRQLRAVELLEHLGTADARRVLAALAAGSPSRQTADAAAAVERLRGRP